MLGFAVSADQIVSWPGHEYDRLPILASCWRLPTVRVHIMSSRLPYAPFCASFNEVTRQTRTLWEGGLHTDTCTCIYCSGCKDDARMQRRIEGGAGEMQQPCPVYSRKGDCARGSSHQESLFSVGALVDHQLIALLRSGVAAFGDNAGAHRQLVGTARFRRSRQFTDKRVRCLTLCPLLVGPR
ncbi:hypothetical protein PYCCODRAFT_362815 [Trametes coccinea BRFM310]|uniref:Uncharacterized protein n=1 Tax=Trametes coccinea (strain BRFM310) TaxID=1353009 RepID=A0A1Y2J3B6_TRAC3|nr:hypothetical protein PYCCODRAFT_362815 [Trametes coccinea BRFM310]